jgi:mono/diheme cytochrome c family protein
MKVLERIREGAKFGSTGGVAFVAAALSPLMLSSFVSADPQAKAWVAPASAKVRKNPVRPTPEGLKEAADLFQQVCSSCHGPTGAGDGVLAKALTPKPANFTDGKTISRAADGELFWKITNGRNPMPSWQQLPEKQRWELVNYLRTLTAKGNTTRKKTQTN